jgi:penicillin amidase
MFQTRRGRRGQIALLPLLMLLLVLTILAGGIGGWRWLSTSLPVTEGEIKVLGLAQPVTITRDAQGIPSIRAESEADAYFALGFVHAQDRLWQMDLNRRIAQGRLAEIAGRAGLNNDRFFRVLGLQSRVETTFEHLDEPTKQILTAYASGINAWIAGLDRLHQPPMEFILAGIRPKPWRPADTLLWPRVMALQLAGNWREEMLNLKLFQRLGAERARQISPMTALPERLSGLPVLPDLAQLPEAGRSHLASNMWAVAGDRSTTGSPLLANDPHLNFQAPILWYLAKIEAPGLFVQGGTIPGQPFVMVGQNKHVAWGLTSAHADTMDLFVETMASEDGKTYQTPDGPASFLTRQEIIQIKGEPDYAIEVRETRHGPVVSDGLNAKETPKGITLSLAATALNPVDRSAQAMRKMSLAHDTVSFRQALGDFQAPVQYIAFAATDGQIGLQQIGLVPLRKGQASPDLPRPGADGLADWLGFVPPNELPSQLNPPDGVLLNANNRLAADDYPHHLASNWPDNWRAERIAQLLAAKPQQGPDDMSAYQMDSLSTAFLHLKPFLLAAPPSSPQAGKILDLLRNWDGSMDGDLVEPTLFSAWAEELQRALFADELRRYPDDPDDLPSPFDAWSPSLKPQMIEMALNGDGTWCDDESTKDRQETCPDIVVRAFDESLRRLKRDFSADMTQWRWGKVHKAKFAHGILERLPVPENWIAPSIETDGDGSSLNRGSFAFGNFRHVHGAGLRAVCDVKNPKDSRFMIATGQSGNPLSVHYDDLLKPWRDGGYLKLDGHSKSGELVLWPVQANK